MDFGEKSPIHSLNVMSPGTTGRSAFPATKIPIIIPDAIEFRRVGRHRQNNFLKIGCDVFAVKLMGDVVGARNAFENFEQAFRGGALAGGIGNAQRQENIFPEFLLPEKSAVLAQQLRHHMYIDFFSLMIPHLFFASERAVYVERFVDFFVSGHLGGLREAIGALALSGCWVLMHRGIRMGSDINFFKLFGIGGESRECRVGPVYKKRKARAGRRPRVFRKETTRFLRKP